MNLVNGYLEFKKISNEIQELDCVVKVTPNSVELWSECKRLVKFEIRNEIEVANHLKLECFYMIKEFIGNNENENYNYINDKLDFDCSNNNPTYAMIEIISYAKRNLNKYKELVKC